MPKSKKKDKVILGVGDPKLGSSINDNLGVSCLHTGVVPEVIRGNVNGLLTKVVRD